VFAATTNTLASLAVTMPIATAVAGHVLYSRPHSEGNWAPLHIMWWGLPASLTIGAAAGCIATLGKYEVLDLSEVEDASNELTPKADADKV